MGKKIIYDLGSNNGDDIPYYLLKSDLVVAVEANPAHCELINQRFATEIENGRVVVENRVVTSEREPREIDFYLHRTASGLSQLPRPGAADADSFTCIRLSSVPILDLVRQWGEPFYVKIDLENYDSEILRALFGGGIRPTYISAEAHSIEVFSLLVSLGRYNAFKLVDGNSVPNVYADRTVVNDVDQSLVPYSFPSHSAGPFGEDVDGEWMTADNFFRLLAIEGLGWKDIHATTASVANPGTVSMRPYVRRRVIKRLKTLGRRVRSQRWKQGK